VRKKKTRSSQSAKARKASGLRDERPKNLAARQAHAIRGGGINRVVVTDGKIGG